MALESRDGFKRNGFLSEETARAVDRLRGENAHWFALAHDTNRALMEASDRAFKSSNGKTSLSREAIAAFILLRSCGLFQAAILMTERGMVVEGRTMVRSLFECLFCIGALLKSPEGFIDILKKDFESSKKNQARFIKENFPSLCDLDIGILEEILDSADKKSSLMSPKRVSELGDVRKEYIFYQRLSDTAVHVSSSSLQHHMAANKENNSFHLRWNSGNESSNASTLHASIKAALYIGVGATELMQHIESNEAFKPLYERFLNMPPVCPI